MRLMGIFRKKNGGLEFIVNFLGTKYQARQWAEWKFHKEKIEIYTVNIPLGRGKKLEGSFYDENGIIISGVLPQGDQEMKFKEDKFSKGFERGVAACWQDVADTLQEILGAVYTPDKAGLMAALEDAAEGGRADAILAEEMSGGEGSDAKN